MRGSPRARTAHRINKEIIVQLTTQRVLLGYSVIATTLAAVLTISHAVSDPRVTKFDEIDVQRINVREPDGTLRMTISNAATAPGIIVKGKEQPHPSRKSAGVLFFNDEGTENGGLIFGGEKKDGKVSGYGHLSFDPYEQDQAIVLEQSEQNGVREAGLSVNDLPDTPLPFDLVARAGTPEGRAELEKLAKAGGFGYSRLYIGKTGERVSTVVLKDAKGRSRLELKVAPDGAASIDFLDENGKAVRTLTPNSK
jgi:hypothetical protein